MISDARADRTELRLRLYENGFTPLPNKNKMCLLEKWSTVTITPEMIQSREWKRSARDRDTGIRCGDVIAIDWDVNDPTLLNALLDEIVAAGVIEESPFVRIGKPPREMWVYRTTDKIGKRTTGFFKHPDAPEDAKSEAVEILGAGCQFAAYGMRDDETAYTWPARSLLDHRYQDLPFITHAQVEAVKEFAIAFFERNGLERKSNAGGTDEGYTHVYDLTDDMVFDVHELGQTTVAELTTYLQSHPDQMLRCRVDVLRPGTSGSLAGMASLVGGMLCISDHGSYTSHWPASADIETKFAALGAALQERFPEVLREPVKAPLPPVSLDADALVMAPEAPFEDSLIIALQRYAYLSETNLIADVKANINDVTVDHFRNMMAPFYSASTGPRGGENLTYLSKLWLEHKDRRTARRAHMRPDQPVPFYTEGVDLYVNTYRPLVLPTDGDPSMGFEIIDRLLPVKAEAEYFRQWLAYKVQHPDTRGPAVVMVAHDNYGTGRGSLVELLKQLFSRGLVRTVDFQTLTGTGTQGQYNEWLADSVMVAINEAQEIPGHGSRWIAKSNAYEHLKLVVDPGSHEVYVKRKGVNNYTGRTSASIVVMTNHLDSLVIPSNDRRFAVLSNGKPPPQEFFESFHAWRRNDSNIGAFIEALKRVSLEGYNPYVAPPMTQAKQDMIDAGASSLDRAMAYVLRDLPGKLLTRDQLQIKLENYLAEVSVEFPENWMRMLDHLFMRHSHSLPGDGMLSIDGRKRIVRKLPGCPDSIIGDEHAMIEELAKNGTQGRTMSSSATVVSFASRRTG